MFLTEPLLHIEETDISRGATIFSFDNCDVYSGLLFGTRPVILQVLGGPLDDLSSFSLEDVITSTDPIESGMCELERRSMTSDSLLSPLIGVVKPQGGVAPNVLVYERLGVSLRALHAPSELLLDAITLPSLLLAISAHIFALRPLKSLLSCDIPITVDTIFVIRSETGYFPKLLSPLVPSNPLPIVQRILIDALSTLLSPPHPNSDTAYLHVLARYLLAILEPECTSAEQLMGLLQTVADSHVPGLVANLPAFHTAASQAVVSALVVDTIASRAILRTDGAVLDFVNVVGSVVAALGRAQSLFKAEAMRLMRVRSQWMDKQAEEVDANEKSLVACARLCAWDDFGPEEVLRGVDDVFALLDGGMFVRRSLFLDLPPNGVSNVFEMLSESTRVQQGLAAPSVGPALHWYKSNEPTLIPIHLRDQLGEPIRGIDAADVTCSITPAVDVQCSIYFTSVSTLMIQLVVPPNVSDALTLHVDLFGHTLLEATVQTATSLMGEELPDKSIVTAHTERNYGLAVSHDGSLLAVANYGSCSVSLYAFPTGTPAHTFGSRGSGLLQFKDPCKLAFCPATGNLLIAEDENCRVQEVTRAGTHVRFLREPGESIGPTVRYRGVDASQDLIAVSIVGAEHCVALFRRDDGTLFTRLPSPGGTCSPLGIRFTPCGRHLVFADFSKGYALRYNDVHSRATSGQMLPVDAPSEPFRFGEGQLKSPFDVCVVPCGDVVVCDPGTCSLVVFAPDGSLLRKVRMSPGRLPIALASHGSVTYLLDGNNSIVRAFH